MPDLISLSLKSDRNCYLPIRALKHRVEATSSRSHNQAGAERQDPNQLCLNLQLMYPPTPAWTEGIGICCGMCSGTTLQSCPSLGLLSTKHVCSSKSEFIWNHHQIFGIYCTQPPTLHFMQFVGLGSQGMGWDSKAPLLQIWWQSFPCPFMGPSPGGSRESWRFPFKELLEKTWRWQQLAGVRQTADCAGLRSGAAVRGQG